MEDRVCEQCGVSIEGSHALRKFCHECSHERAKDRSSLYAKNKREGKPMPPSVCKWCGGETRDARKRCPACEGTDIRLVPLTPRKDKKPATPKKRVRKKPLRRCWDLEHKSTTQVAVEAAALNLSYGQYSGLIDCLMIERHLEAQGIYDGLERIDTAWQAFKKQRKAERRRDKERQRAYREGLSD